MDGNKLIAAGIDYKEGVERFGGQPQIYEKYLVKFFKGNLMDDLITMLDNKQFADAFRVCHDLKGAAGNLSLSEYYVKICVLTEILRRDVVDNDYTIVLSEIKELYGKAKKAVMGELE